MKPAKTQIRPARPMIGVALVALACWYAGASQGNGAATLIGALICGIAVVSALQARRNVHGLTANVIRISEVHAGTRGTIDVALAETKDTRYGIAARLDLPDATWHEPLACPTRGEPLRLSWVPKQRGRTNVGAIHIRSSFPLGWFIAEARCAVTGSCIVYPRLSGTPLLPEEPSAGRESSRKFSSRGEEDLVGHTVHREGESFRHIDWKASARRHQTMLKRFSGHDLRRLTLTWDLPQPSDPEDRLSQLALWVVEAERGGLLYSLILPGTRIPHGHGPRHFQACQRALALYAP